MGSALNRMGPANRTGPAAHARMNGILMPNKPRRENRHRMVRVEDELWEAAKEACAKLGTTRAEVMREALRKAVKDSAARDRKRD